MAKDERKDLNMNYFGQLHSIDLYTKPCTSMSCPMSSEAEIGTLSKDGRIFKAVRIDRYSYKDDENDSPEIPNYGAKYTVFVPGIDKWVGIKNDGDQWYGTFTLSDSCKKKVIEAYALTESVISLNDIETTPPSRLEELAKGLAGPNQ